MIVVFDVTGKQGKLGFQKGMIADEIRWEAGNHAEILGKYLHQITRAKPISQIGVVTGPGSFTGIRIGISLALGMANGGSIPLFAQTRFDLAWWTVNQGLQQQKEPCEGVFIEAFKGKAYCQKAPDRAIELRPIMNLKGPWWGTFTDDQNVAPTEHRQLPPLLPSFITLIKEKAISTTNEPNPLYVRPPDAKVGIPLLERLLNQ